MPRIARGIVDGFTYHVLNRGNGGQRIFRKDQDYKAFISLMEEAKPQFKVHVYAYCLMPNHFHIVAMSIKGNELSKWMQWLMTSHVRRYHKHYGTSGHVWQGRFKSFIVQEDNHLLTILRYVEGNPVRAGLAASAKNWPWSSHNERIALTPSIFVDKTPIELPDNWQGFVDEPLSLNDLKKLHESLQRQAPFGSFNWQTKICQDCGLQSTIRPRGRPAKNRTK